MPIYSQIKSSVLKEKNFKVFAWLPWQPEFCIDVLHLSNFDRGLSKDYLCEVLSKLSERFLGSCHLKQFLTTHDRRRTQPDLIADMSISCSGELKQEGHNGPVSLT